MLTREEQETVVRMAQAMAARYHARRLKVARGTMDPKHCRELCKQDEEELREILKEAG